MSAALGARVGNVLGFDFGLRCIGVAVGTTLAASARPLAVLTAHSGAPDWSELDALLRAWSPLALVVGLPLDGDGSEQPITCAARGFAAQLRQRYRIDVHLCDERHSSQEAARRFATQRAAGQRRKRDAAQLDALAAAVILESWLSETSCTRTCAT
ncbi:Holliday junction resolvase RuvX [Metallibacterium sp.]